MNDLYSSGLLSGRTVLITGAARRIGKHLALSVARAGGNVIVHHGHSAELALQTCAEIRALGVEAHAISADLGDPLQAAGLIEQANQYGKLYALVNNAAIFAPLALLNTRLEDWQSHLSVNLTAPFLLSQAFASALPAQETGRIVNILDWRALRPGADHFPYTISKAGLAALTRAMAAALAPRIQVNGLALGAILPPSDAGAAGEILAAVPAKRWADLDEVGDALLFLLAGPAYITGEIIHVDGGRHLV